MQLPRSERLLSVDLGEKTIGLALSDERQVIASPLHTIKRSKFSKDIETLKALIAEHHVGGMVIGLPINMDGTQGPRCQSAKQFANNVRKHMDIPILFWDERLSTAAVEKAMLEADLSRASRAEKVDKLAAAYILQGYLDSLV